MKIKYTTKSEEYELPTIRPGDMATVVDQLIPGFVRWGRSEVAWPLVYALALSLLDIDITGMSMHEIDEKMDEVRSLLDTFRV